MILSLLIFTHQSCAQLDNMLVASWSRTLAVVAYSSVLHRTKSSAYIAHFTGAGNCVGARRERTCVCLL